MSISFLDPILHFFAPKKPPVCPHKEAALKLIKAIEPVTYYEPRPGEPKRNYQEEAKKVNDQAANFTYPLSDENQKFAIKHCLFNVLTQNEKVKARLEKVDKQLAKALPPKRKNEGQAPMTELNKMQEKKL